MKILFRLLFLLLFLGNSPIIFAQAQKNTKQQVALENNVGINTANPDPSAALDISSTTKGLLIPRMTEAQRLAIVLPAVGLLVYQIDGATVGFYVKNGSGWASLSIPGAQGFPGADGKNGLKSLIKTSIQSPNASCNGGGIKVESGLDINNDNILQNEEVLAFNLVCNGINGFTGQNGKNTLVKTTDEPIGANCATGGVKIEYGIDNNSNNVLDVSEINATLTKYVCNGGFIHYVGEQFGGGVVFHVWKDNLGVEHGLIAALIRSAGALPYSNVATQIGTGAQNTWDGLANSESIVNQPGHATSAAGYSLLFTDGAFSDWYLPSLGEMKLLNTNLFNVNKTLSTIVGATEVSLLYHWTSTESGTFGVAMNMFTGSFAELSKSTGLAVRPIRAF